MPAADRGEYAQQLAGRLQDPDRLRALATVETWFDDAGWQERARTFALLAAQMLSTELAQVSLVSGSAVRGVRSTGGPEHEVAVGASYCQHVVGTGGPVLVSDSLLDPLVRDSVTAQRLRAYLGIPLRRDGLVLGALCVAQVGPRAWTDVDVALLTELAAELLLDGPLPDDRS